ncbi:MAG: SDR family NAD(P)-dependent oxidoreductase [Bacteroidia bacterium]
MNRKKILITGHSSGLGKHIVEDLLSTNEYEIVGIARRKINHHPLLHQITCDLSNYTEVKKLNHSLSKYKFDIIVLNAGANTIKPAEAYQIDEIQKLIQLNFTSHALIFRMCINGLIKTKGLVIGVGSYSGKDIKRWNNYYGASKAAFHHFMHNMFEQYRKQDVKFSLIIPDIINSPFYEKQDYKPIPDTKHSLEINQISNFICNQLIKNKTEFYPLETVFRPLNFILK